MLDRVLPSGDRRLTDTPWFWVYVFATSGLAALLVIGPKYQQRQNQLERQYRARVESHQTTEIPGVLTATDQPNAPFITLWPLALFLGLVVVIFAGVVTIQIRGTRAAGRIAPPPP